MAVLPEAVLEKLRFNVVRIGVKAVVLVQAFTLKETDTLQFTFDTKASSSISRITRLSLELKKLPAIGNSENLSSLTVNTALLTICVPDRALTKRSCAAAK